jgi:hypothetical protein
VADAVTSQKLRPAASFSAAHDHGNGFPDELSTP